MRKILAIIFIIAMVASMAVPVMAHSDNINQGSVPKTSTAPTLDAVKDDIYDQGLKISVKNPYQDQTAVLGGGGEAWYLWDDNFLYVFMSFNVADAKNLYTTDDYEDTWKNAPWELTCVEFHIDFSNVGKGREFVKYRVVDKGQKDSWIGKGDVIYGADSDAQFTVASAFVGNTWNVEYKISFAGSKAACEEENISFGDDVKAGKQIGVMIFFQEVNKDGEMAMYFCVPTDRADPNSPGIFDYVVLGDKVVSAAAPVEEVPAPEEAAVEEDAPVAAVPETRPAAPVTSPRTGDLVLPIFLFVMLAVIGTKSFRLIKNR